MAKTDSPAIPAPLDAPAENLNIGDLSANSELPTEVDKIPTGPVVAEADKGEEVLARNNTSSRKIQVDRFGSDTQIAIKNTAWEKDKFNKESIPHRHFFDSHARRSGKPNQYLTFMAGHTHKFEYAVDTKGNLIPSSFKCGNALIERTVSDGTGKSTREMQLAVVWTNPETGQRTIDTHTHAVTYRKTEQIEVKA